MEAKITEKYIPVEGMSCSSCELKIERNLKRIEGVVDVKASFGASEVFIKYQRDIVDIEDILTTIEELGYGFGKESSSLGNPSKNDRENLSIPRVDSKSNSNMTQVLGILIILFSLYMIIKNTIGFNFIPEVNETMGYGMLFIVGLLTSIHCISMCGGINLSQCVSYKYKEGDSSFAKLKPSLTYNMGRVISYTIIGGLAGALGSVISPSGTAKGLVSVFAGIFMIIMGLNMLNIFPSLRKFNIKMPKFFGNKVHDNISSNRPLYVGLLNGLMPCGPLQAMQLYALGTGSFAAGALSMFLFSIGTVPLMFGFGAISSLLSSKATNKMFKVSAILVMALGVLMFQRGLSLSGIATSFAAPASASVATISGGYQEVSFDLKSNSYSPLIVQAGIPVRLKINVESKNLNGCNNPITIPQFNKQVRLVPGENIIEFTPDKEGNIVYTCWMGMITSNIKVVSDISKVSSQDIDDLEKEAQSSQGGGSCCGAPPTRSSTSDQSPIADISTDNIGVGEIIDGIQYITINVNQDGVFPAAIVLQKNIETKWTIIAEGLSNWNNPFIFPEYGARISLRKGENLIEFVPDEDFTFLCSLGELGGYVRVIDDLEKTQDADEMEYIREEIDLFKTITRSPGRGCH